jgi:hypothetical protein
MKKMPVLLASILLASSVLLANEFTIKRQLVVDEEGYSSTQDPVEAFSNAIENAKRTAASLVEGQIKGGSSTVNGEFSSDWVEKKANIQFYDVKILKKDWVSPGDVKVKLQLTAGYLDIPKFWTEYDKTVQGASFRTVVMPGWGQGYNREYFSAGLYGVFYWAFYVIYLIKVDAIKNTDEVGLTTVSAQFQLPALLFWTLAVSDASISRLMEKFGLEQIKESYRADAGGPRDSKVGLTFDIPVLRKRF